MGAMPYLVNREGAKEILYAEKKYLADDWYSWKSNGIKIYALRPHIAGDFDLFGSVLRVAMKAGNAKICRLRINYVLTTVVSSDEFWGELVIGRQENDSALRI